jgi:hypothetical protein
MVHHRIARQLIPAHGACNGDVNILRRPNQPTPLLDTFRSAGNPLYGTTITCHGVRNSRSARSHAPRAGARGLFKHLWGSFPCGDFMSWGNHMPHSPIPCAHHPRHGAPQKTLSDAPPRDGAG